MLALPASAPAQEHLFRFDLRAGAVYSTTLATGSAVLPEDQGLGVARTVTLQPDVGIHVDAALLFPFSPTVDGELRIGLSRSGVRGDGPIGKWDGGSLTAIQGTAGLDVDLSGGFVARGGLGKLVYSSSSVTALTAGSDTGLLLTAGLGYRIPVNTSFGLRVDLDGQVHPFGTPVLREAGAADDWVARVLLQVAATFGSGG